MIEKKVDRDELTIELREKASKNETEMMLR